MEGEKKFEVPKFTKQWAKARRKISVGSCANEIQCEHIVAMNSQTLGAKTGPFGGFVSSAEQQVSQDCPDGDDMSETSISDIEDPTTPNDEPSNKEDGTLNWNRPIVEANGDSVTLYDFKPGSGEHYGDPIADVYAVVARHNNAILAIADGCDWGPKARDAARSAVRGSMEYLNRRLFDPQHPLSTTQDVMNAILHSFDAAHKCILETEGATSASLCVAVVCQLVRSVRNKNWCVCVANLGESSCFVWSNRKAIVQEVTYMCASGMGCLGHALGDKPDKSNLSCSFLPVHENDTVFLVTNGISQNFDPVTLLRAVERDKTSAEKGGSAVKGEGVQSTLPVMSPEERESAKLAKMTEVLLNARSHKRVEYLNAAVISEALIDYAIQVTDEKRRFLERSWGDPDYTDAEDKSTKEHEVLGIADDYPGKVDHATVVAYKVGFLPGEPANVRRSSFAKII